MRKEPGQINPRIAVIVHDAGGVGVGSSNSGSGIGGGNPRRGLVEGERDVVGERVARVVGGMHQQQKQQHYHQQQQQQRLALAVPVLEFKPRGGGAVGSSHVGGGCNGGSSGIVEGNEHAHGDEGVVDVVSATAEGVGAVSLVSPCSAFPPLSPSPSPLSAASPIWSCSSCSKTTGVGVAAGKAPSKLGKRVIELRLRLSRTALHKRWWQRRLKNKYHNPWDHILSSCSRRLHRINQRIEMITKKHQILRYDRIAEKYLHWENHLREQMMIRRWGTRKNAELDRERRAELVKLEHLRKRRDVLVKMISASNGSL